MEGETGYVREREGGEGDRDRGGVRGGKERGRKKRRRKRERRKLTHSENSGTRG